MCTQGQIAPTSLSSAQEKGKQPRDFLESGIREITLLVAVLDCSKMQQ